PLSLLPFDLDLLFELHLLQKGQEQMRRKEQLCSAGQSSRSTFQLMRGWSTTVSEMVRDSGTEVKNERPGLRREGTWPGMDRAECRREAVGMDLWKDRPVEGQRVKGVGQEGVDVKERDRRKEKDPGEESRQRGNKQAGWWYQLMQSSQVYIDQSTEGSKFVKAEKRKKSSERRQNQPPPTREGVVEGAESISVGEKGASSNSSSGVESAGSRGSRPSWMGSPPESVLNQEKDINVVEDSGSGVLASSQEESPSQGQSLRWGRLFGSTAGSPQRAEGAELRVKPQKTSEVRALCHHIATEPGQLSFNKGDILRVLKKADPDWLLCSLGSTQGLVPIIYVTLNNMEDSHRETGLKQL
ncbi:hypothetical protein GOODEAATRI_020973, partial [Goodea atripinnis]